MGWFGKKQDPAPQDAERQEDQTPRSQSATSSSDFSRDESEKKDLVPSENHIDPVMEKRVVRKLDWNIIPVVGLLLLLSVLDRGNIGNARLAGMTKDLKLTSDKYDWLLTIFYISFIVFSFTGFMWRIVKPHQWGAAVVLGWGIVATCQAAAQNWQGMMALRFLLGMFEAGYSQSLAFVLSFFYTRKELGFRVGMWASFAPAASTFSNALAYGITAGHPAIANWRLLFLVEGLPTIVAAGITYFFLPDSGSTARFLTVEEREIARLRTEKQSGKAEADREGGVFSWKDVGEVLVDPVEWFMSFIFFSTYVSYSAIPVFLPTIIEEMGFSNASAQGLAAPPFFSCIFVILLTTWYADRIQERGIMIIILCSIGGAGYLMLATCTNIGARYAGVFLAINGGYTAIAHVLAWVVNNQGTVTRRGVGNSIMVAIGQCGAVLGTDMFPLSDGPRYVKGQSICAAFLFFGAILALGNRQYMVWQNKKLDKKYGPRVERSDVAGIMDDGDENFGRNFRYIL